MSFVMRHLHAVRRPAIAALGAVPLGLATALAQTAPPPVGEVPYLNLPPAFAPANPPGDPPGLRPSDVPATNAPTVPGAKAPTVPGAKPATAPGAKPPTVQDTIKQ